MYRLVRFLSTSILITVSIIFLLAIENFVFLYIICILTFSNFQGICETYNITCRTAIYILSTMLNFKNK